MSANASFIKSVLTRDLKPGKNIRLFASDFLENLTYVHPVLPALIWLPVSLGLPFYSVFIANELSFLFASVFYIFGLLFWTFAEYILHRFVFHYKPRNAFESRIMYLIHGVHHDDPEDQRRLVMPPAAALILATILFSFFYFLLGSIFVKPFFGGFLLGYLFYDYIHFATHFSRIDGGWFKAVKENHMKHHFVLHDKLFGVSSPFWDHVFDTFKKNKRV